MRKRRFMIKNCRRGVSPVIATTIILAITITLGLGLWSFANSGVSTATNTYANVITAYGNYTSDRFVIANIAFDYPSNNEATVWVYNNGHLGTEIKNIILTCKAPKAQCGSFPPVSVGQADLRDTNGTPKALGPIPTEQLQKVSFTSGSLASGITYEIRVISSTGAYQTYYLEK